MIKKLKGIRFYGLFFSIASALFIIAFSAPFFTEARLMPYLYNSGIDSFGALICVALYYGCLAQKGEGIRAFRILILLVSACFVVNEVISYTILVPECRALCFVFCLLSKLIDLAMIFLFYLYVRETLGFEGKLARIAEKLAYPHTAGSSSTRFARKYYYTNHLYGNSRGNVSGNGN